MKSGYDRGRSEEEDSWCRMLMGWRRSRAGTAPLLYSTGSPMKTHLDKNGSISPIGVTAPSGMVSSTPKTFIDRSSWLAYRGFSWRRQENEEENVIEIAGRAANGRLNVLDQISVIWLGVGGGVYCHGSRPRRVKTSIPYRWQALCGGDGHSQVTGCILLFLSIDEDQIQVLGSFDLYRKIGRIRNKSIALHYWSIGIVNKEEEVKRQDWWRQIMRF